MFYVVTVTKKKKKNTLLICWRIHPSQNFHVARKLDGASKGRAARYNSHSDSRARPSDNDNERSRRGNPFDLGADFVFRSEWSRRVSAARSGTHRRTCSPDATIETHSDMLIRFENKCNGNPPLSFLPPASAPPAYLSFPRQRSCSRAIFIANRTLLNYPAAAKSAPSTRVSHVCARAFRTTCPCPHRGRGDHLKNKKQEEKKWWDAHAKPRRWKVSTIGAPTRLVVVVVVISVYNTFLVNNENFCCLAGGTRVLHRSSYNVSCFFFFSFPRGSARLRIMTRFQCRGCSTMDMSKFEIVIS